ncbi:hypothetical protein DAEQUDRAFT_577746 [Daedalea quercina L-15889]|uniref:Uncharacterized protein n=1 Tax=Daedalea quercina L-15889 TaxID=1314783 RepID=A0A165LV94_9APHY|nr:hypothetical protein DAEQUDRAFT_577746 [Daedalea quercina L-15889]
MLIASRRMRPAQVGSAGRAREASAGAGRLSLITIASIVGAAAHSCAILFFSPRSEAYASPSVLSSFQLNSHTLSFFHPNSYNAREDHPIFHRRSDRCDACILGPAWRQCRRVV